jgi:seryl-tRNA synthetase
MHDIRFIRDNPAAFDAGLKKRGLEPLSAKVIKLDNERKAAIAALQEASEQRNALSKEIGKTKAAKDEARAQELMAQVAGLKEIMPKLESEQREAEAALDKVLKEIPNLPNADVPEGVDEHGNVLKSNFESIRPQLMEGKAHDDLGVALGLMDFEAAARMSGARFTVLKGGLARLERALGQFMLDTHTEQHGYVEVNPPLLVRDQAMVGTAQLPKFEEDLFGLENIVHNNIKQNILDIRLRNKRIEYHKDQLSKGSRLAPQRIEDEEDEIKQFQESIKASLDTLLDSKHNNTYLIPTAEVPLTNLVRESILSESELPLRYTALTPCFRAEAGSAGRDTKGMLRQHQFNKVELVSITTPDQSAEEHERMLACAEAILKKLDLPYRVMKLCTGDMGFAAAKTYDIEVWMPAQKTYREISSVSTCNDFQARRMEARYRGVDGKIAYLHTLNGSGIAVGRALIAVMENYQNEDGSITVPDVLVPYMGGMTRVG